MKLIQRSPFGTQGRSIPFLDRIRGIWTFGLAWDRDTQAQQVLIQQLGSLLDNTYTLISNIPVPGVSIPVPLVLISKTGIYTFCVSADTGIFSLKGGKWYKLDEQKEQYRPSRPNLVRRTALMSRAIVEYLKDKGVFVDESEATLYFTKPGVHIDEFQSPVNLVQSDGIDRYVENIRNEDVVLDTMELQRITDILIQSESRAKGKAKAAVIPSRSKLSTWVGIGDFQMKVWQLLILFVLAILMLIVVILTTFVIINSG